MEKGSGDDVTKKRIPGRRIREEKKDEEMENRKREKIGEERMLEGGDEAKRSGRGQT